MRLRKLHRASSNRACVPWRLTSWELLGPSLAKSDRLRHRARSGALQVIHVYGVRLLLPLAWCSCWCCLLDLIVLITFAHELLLSCLGLVHLICTGIIEC